MIVTETEAMAHSVGSLLRAQASAHPDRALVVAPDGSRISYREVDEASDRLALALREQGIGAGDHVAMMLTNELPILLTWCALAKLGAVEVPLNTSFKGMSLEYLLQHSDVSMVIVEEQYADRFDRFAGTVPGLRSAVVVRPEVPSGGSGAELPWPTTEFADLVARPADEPLEIVAGPDDLLAILYTSGTTGHPKGVMESHRCAIHWGLNYRRYMAVDPDDVNLLFSPLHHAMSQFLGVMPALLSGSAVAVVNGFSASGFWEVCRTTGATLFNFTGGVLSFLWKQPERPDDSANPVLRALGVPIPDDLYPGFESRFGLSLLPCFGTSESNVVCYSTPGEVRRGSSGRPVDEFVVDVVDDDGHPVPRGTKGEIVTRPKKPDSMMRGYYKQPELTAKVLRDLWYHTGDMGYVDDDGYLFFVDRRKDAIRRRGENISSFEIERVVNAHPAVLESVAVGVASEHGEEEVKLAVVPMAGADLTVHELWDYCDRELPAFMVPRYLELRESLPKTPTERVMKYVIRDEGVHEGVVDRVSDR
ncbi:AMP-binding protein [Nocardioides halotolerans]|uniref:AMP-binding protein n=1 Tax=Nocardioides halotolerans TaxID=433660 RepID=UPI00042655DD|nr:AMP-binding protein [Nocardioides halotolerans]